jgi:3-oxoadipate enol-lactonase
VSARHAVHLKREGAGGTPVLLLHGIGGSSSSFTEQSRALAAGHRVMAWDAPGYGASPDPVAPPGISGYAHAAREVLDTYGAAHVVGCSFGGVVATRLALDHPELVLSLTLADSSRGSGRSPDAGRRMRERLTRLSALGPEAFARERGPTLLSPRADEAVREAVIASMSRVRMPGYGYAAAAMAETDHTDILKSIAVPTLVLVGEDDQVTGVEEARALAAGIPHARLHVIPAAGHTANREAPEVFNQHLLRFLTEHDGGRTRV